jgi:hypothetical protein
MINSSIKRSSYSYYWRWPREKGIDTAKLLSAELLVCPMPLTFTPLNLLLSLDFEAVWENECWV